MGSCRSNFEFDIFRKDNHTQISFIKVLSVNYISNFRNENRKVKFMSHNHISKGFAMMFKILADKID